MRLNFNAEHTEVCTCVSWTSSKAQLQRRIGFHLNLDINDGAGYRVNLHIENTCLVLEVLFFDMGINNGNFRIFLRRQVQYRLQKRRQQVDSAFVAEDQFEYEITFER